MASKLGLAGGIPERRVRPIWDNIDSRQYKNALKLSTSLLSKHPNSPYALALKALILERMGKCDEALSSCLNAKGLLYKDESLLMDDLTLSTLQIVFQRLDRLDLATSCYEYACGKYPNNMDLMMGLFNCYVREYSFVKQQQTAIKMYKLVGEERFLIWAVCSIQLQVLCDNGGEKLLALAEGLLKKHVSSHSLHEPEAVMVYIAILEWQAKYGDALEILSGKLGSLLLIEADKLRIQGRLHAQSGDYSAGANIYQKILRLCPDDWECFLNYLRCLLEDDSNWNNRANNDLMYPKLLDCKVSNLADGVFDSRISDALAYVQKLQAQSNDDSIRCPYLATLEIGRRKLLHEKGSQDEIVQDLLQYFSKFGHLTCFTSDVEVYVQSLTPEKKAEFLDKLMKNFNSISTVPTRDLGTSITKFKVRELIGDMNNLSVSELEGYAVQMVDMYCTSLPLSKDLDLQESMYGEELLSLACNLLVQLFCRTRQVGYIAEAIMVLEFGLTIRRCVWHYKILLLHLHSYFGNLTLALQWYKSLDVKNILMETALHHILPEILVSPLWKDLENLLRDYLRFMDDHFRESADLTFLAYRHRNYSKVIEFVEFKERLQRSNQYLVARIESSILQLKQKADNVEEEEGVLESLDNGSLFVELSNKIGSKNLTFNEDFNARPWWTPVPGKNYLLGPFEGVSYCPKENMAKEREENVKKVIERKSLLPRLVYLSIQSASTISKEKVEMNGSSTVPKIPSELKFLLERYAKLLGSTLDDAIKVTMEVSSGVKSLEVFGSELVDWMNFAVFLNAWDLSSSEHLVLGDKHEGGVWPIIDALLEKSITVKTKFMEPRTYSPKVDLSSSVELVTGPLAWHILVLQSCVRSSLPSGKKKKKGGVTDQATARLSNGVRSSILSLYGVVEGITVRLKSYINVPEEENMDCILSSIKRDERVEGPGQAFKVLETSVSSADEAKLGSRIFDALKSWSPVDVAREIINGESACLSEFLRICETKLKSLRTLKQQTAQA